LVGVSHRLDLRCEQWRGGVDQKAWQLSVMIRLFASDPTSVISVFTVVNSSSLFHRKHSFLSI
jgi:hypothetical protein